MGGALPNLLIAGVPKGGTSSLFRYLAQHPDICPAAVKEIAYFNPLRREGAVLPSLESYKAHFAHCEGEKYAMEATPSYCYGGGRMIEGIKQTLGRPRVIISLRNPVDRLWSAYTFQRTKGHLEGVRSFEDYVSICIEKRQNGKKQGPYFGGVTISFYGEYVPSWFDRFDEDVKIIFTDDLFADPAAVVSELCRWLSIDHHAATGLDYLTYNKTTHARSIKLSQATRTLKQRGDGLLKRVPAVEKSLRKTYVRLNSGELDETLQPQTRRDLDEMYRESNLAVSVALKARGYDRLPPWLERQPAAAG